MSAAIFFSVARSVSVRLLLSKFIEQDAIDYYLESVLVMTNFTCRTPGLAIPILKSYADSHSTIYSTTLLHGRQKYVINFCNFT